MTAQPVLRSNSRADLLALPSYLFQFRPSESLVVIAMRGNVVNFSARLDVDWFLKAFDETATQVLNATEGVSASEFFLLGYSADPDLACISATELADVLGRHLVAEALVTDGGRYWSLIDGDGPHPLQLDSSPITAQAVYTGVNIATSREEAVAPVATWAEPDEAEVEPILDEIAALGPDAALGLVRALAESEASLSRQDALRLACLLLDEDLCGAVLTRLRTTNAETFWGNLVAARQVTPADAQPTVVSLLGLTCWLAGHGAQATECVEQIAALDAQHPIGSILIRVHQLGIAPSAWDED